MLCWRLFVEASPPSDLFGVFVLPTVRGEFFAAASVSLLEDSGGGAASLTALSQRKKRLA